MNCQNRLARLNIIVALSFRSIVPVFLFASCNSYANDIFRPEIPVINYNSPLGKSIKITTQEDFGFNMFGVEYLCGVVGGSNGQDIATARALISSVYKAPFQNDFKTDCKMFYQSNQLLNIGSSGSKRKQQKVVDITNQFMNLAYNIENQKLQQLQKSIKQKNECHDEIDKAKDRDFVFIDAALKANDKSILNQLLNNSYYNILSVNSYCKNTPEYTTALQDVNQKRSQIEIKLATIDKPMPENRVKTNRPLQANNKTKKKSIGNLELCKAAIGMAFGHSPSIIEKINISDTTVSVGYIRNMDNTQWNYECRFKGNEVIWRALPGSTTNTIGRWRDSYEEFDDPKLTYVITGNKVSITESYNDGSQSTKSFSF